MEPADKRARTGGTMPPELKEQIEKKLAALGEVWRYKRPHRKGAGLAQARCLPPEDLIHNKGDIAHRGQSSRFVIRVALGPVGFFSPRKEVINVRPHTTHV